MRRSFLRPLGPPAPAPPRGASAAPFAAAGAARQAARSAGALLPGPDPDIDDAIPGDTPGHIDGRAAFIEDRTVPDREPVAIGAVARSAVGDDEHAPVAIVRCSRSSGL